MKIVKGIPVSSGVVMARVFVIEERDHTRVAKRHVPAERVDAEIERFEAARGASVAELDRVHQQAISEMGPEAAKIFQFHMGALGDRSLIEPMERMIREERVTAEYAATHHFQRWIDLFSEKKDSTFQTKISDLRDLSQRLVSHLIGARLSTLADLREPVIVAAHDLTPSQTAGFDRSLVLGLVTDLGGRTSHTAIIARALGLPAVVGTGSLTELCDDGTTIVLDGERGEVVIDPDRDTVEHYRGIIERQRRTEASLGDLRDLPAVTTDGVAVELLGNIEFPHEIPSVLEHGGVGVGLYRTEFLYLMGSREPTEDEQFESYRECVELLGEGGVARPLIIRTFDLGADKYNHLDHGHSPERNPALGLRSIRYCLQHTGMFKTQLRAILRASAFGRLKVMFPLVSSIGELRRARFLLREVMEDLAEEGVAFDARLPVGMMVEVPSVALMPATYAREADFLSIGTNDLVQYTLAVDRINERVASLYQPAHPAVLKLIRDVSRAGRRHGSPVSCCGESAADIENAALLIGLGVRTLSVTASAIPTLKRVVRAVSAARCERIAKKAISFDSEAEAAAYVRSRVRKMVPEAYEGRRAGDAVRPHSPRLIAEGEATP